MIYPKYTIGIGGVWCQESGLVSSHNNITVRKGVAPIRGDRRTISPSIVSWARIKAVDPPIHAIQAVIAQMKFTICVILAHLHKSG